MHPLGLPNHRMHVLGGAGVSSPIPAPTLTLRTVVGFVEVVGGEVVWAGLDESGRATGAGSDVECTLPACPMLVSTPWEVLGHPASSPRPLSHLGPFEGAQEVTGGAWQGPASAAKRSRVINNAFQGPLGVLRGRQSFFLIRPLSHPPKTIFSNADRPWLEPLN